TSRNGWHSVTMAQIASLAGVSRQTVNNEQGSKTQLAHAMVFDELGRFLAVVDAAFDRYPGSLDDAVHEAVLTVLEFAAENTLLRSIVSAGYGADSELLQLLTTDAGSLLSTTKGQIAKRIDAYDVDLDEQQIMTVIDVIVRTTLSHIMRPSGARAETADGLAWITRRTLQPG